MLVSLGPSEELDESASSSSDGFKAFLLDAVVALLEFGSLDVAEKVWSSSAPDIVKSMTFVGSMLAFSHRLEAERGAAVDFGCDVFISSKGPMSLDEGMKMLPVWR